MKKLEKIFVLITVLAIIMRVILISGSSELLVLGASVLALLYCFFSFALLNNIRLRHIFKKSSYLNISGKRILISILIGFSISAIIFGILFKLLILPGAYEMLTIGIIPTIFLIATLLLIGKDSNRNFKSFYIRIVPILMLGLLLYITPLESLVRILYRENPDYVEAAIESLNNPDNLELETKMQEEWDKMQYPKSDE